MKPLARANSPAVSMAILLQAELRSMVGYDILDVKAERIQIPILPLIVSIAVFLIADIDSPRRGAVHVHPQNLIRLSESLCAR
jgi:hypothetical protein